MTGQRVIRLCACGRCGGIRRTKAYTYAPDCPHAFELRRAKIGAANRARHATIRASLGIDRRKSKSEIDKQSYARRMRGCGRDKDISHAEIESIMALHTAYVRYLRNTGQVPALTSDGWRRIGNLTDYAPGPGELPTVEEMAQIVSDVRKPKRHVRQGAVRKAKAA